jgi:hypothetical protein
MMPIFGKPKILSQTGQYKLPRSRAEASTMTAKPKLKAPTKPRPSSGLDSGLEALQNSLAQAEAQRTQ